MHANAPTFITIKRLARIFYQNVFVQIYRSKIIPIYKQYRAALFWWIVFKELCYDTTSIDRSLYSFIIFMNCFPKLILQWGIDQIFYAFVISIQKWQFLDNCLCRYICSWINLWANSYKFSFFLKITMMSHLQLSMVQLFSYDGNLWNAEWFNHLSEQKE